MIHKKLIRPDRVRQVPPSFNWVDHRLVRDNHINACDCTSLALYLFLITVSDVQGLSYYSDASISRRLKIDPLLLSKARRQLEQAGLIAFRKPIYQVLSLEPASSASPLTEKRAEQVQSAADILKKILHGGGQ
ncbi:MAG: hypothetical protein LC674_00770 [Actinobacteria bacterium]|nr:hypothetical protein [Actinomycetota bacterium]